MNSLSQWAEVTRSAFPAQQSHHDPFNDFLGIIDIDFLAACEYTNFRIHGTNVGMRIPPADGHALGQGGTYFVRRVAYDSSLHRIAALGELWKDPKPSFAVLKQESIDDNDSIVNIKDIDHMRSAMLEMRILRHAPVHEHPNIIGLYQMRWDVHDDFRLVSPSVVMEYGHFGTLADFQDHEFLSLNWSSKKGLCLDVAQGLQFLHECGIIHGDIKTENVLICKHPQEGYIAKLSDFGSSLIDTFDTSSIRKVFGTPGWAAPESHLELDPLGLRKLDVYSFGLLAWAVTLNGVKPWAMLAKGPEGVVEVRNVGNSTRLQSDVTYMEFDKLKATKPTDRVLNLARETLVGRHQGDIDSNTVDVVLSRALQGDPNLRASDFKEIISILQDRGSGRMHSLNTNALLPQPLQYGDFGLTSPLLPWYIFTLNTCPASFRRLICTEIQRVIAKVHDEKPREAQLKLALAICHIQNFAPEPNLQYATEIIYQSARAGNVKAQHMCKACFDSCGRPYPFELEGWLTDGIRRGSALARRSLEALNPILLRSVDDDILESRQRLGDRWLREIRFSGSKGINPKQLVIDDLDEIFKFFATRDGVTPLHLASLTGNVPLLRALLNESVEARNAYGETPLHYACISRSTTIIRVLCEEGSNVNSKSDMGATPIHFAVLAFAPRDAIQVLCDFESDLRISSTSIDSLSESLFSDYYFRLIGTPLYWATATENIDAVDALLDNGSDPWSGDPKSSNPPAWQLAFSNRSMDIIQLIISSSKKFHRSYPGFDEIVPHLGDKLTTPLRLMLHGSTSRRELVQKVSLLLCRDTEVNEIGVLVECIDVQLFPEDVTSLVEGIIIKRDLQPGTDYGVYRYRNFNTDNITVVPISLESLLSIALFCGSVEIVRVLLKHIGNIGSTMAPQQPYFEAQGPGTLIQETYFQILCNNTYRSDHELTDLVECLIAHGGNRSAKSLDPFSGSEVCALEEAARNHRLAAVKVFLDSGIGNPFKALIAALSDSSSTFSLPIVTLLLERHPGVLLETIPTGSSPFSTEMILGKEGSSGIFLFLNILCNANELDRNDVITEKKMRRIWDAAQKLPGGSAAVTDAMRWKDLTGSTLLHQAVRHGNIPLCEILLQMGADVNAMISFPDVGNLIHDVTQSVTLPQPTGVPGESQVLPDKLESTSIDPGSSQQEITSLATFDTGDISFIWNGPTPLDLALRRDWTDTIQSFWKSRSEMLEIHRAGGDHKQRRKFIRKTDDIVWLLREMGGKRSSEL